MTQSRATGLKQPSVSASSSTTSLRSAVPSSVESITDSQGMGGCLSADTKDVTTKGALPEGTSIFFVLGGPGSGKGTQCERIAAKYNCAHISAGDLLRNEVAKQTELGKQCDALMKEGKLVPIETTLTLLQKAMLKSDKATFLIDGLPRSIDQATRFEAEIQPCAAVLFFECSEEVMKVRLMERGKTSGRADDNEATIQARLKTFVEMSAPVAQFYAAQGKCYTVTAEETPEVVFEKVQEILDRYLKANGEATKAKGAIDAPSGTQSLKEEDPSETPSATETPIELLKIPTEVSPPTAASETEIDASTTTEAVEAAEPTATVEDVSENAEVVVKATSYGSVIFVLGGPGSGKGTQCERIVNDYGYRHISVGDLLRAEVESCSELGQECDALMKEGKLVPVSITLELLKAAISKGEAESYLIDGFPRSTEQALLFEKDIAVCDGVLFFDCSEDVMLERMMERSKVSGRADDNPETMKARLETFKDISAPVVQFYSDQGKCHIIPAERDPSEIYADVKAILDDLKEKRSPELCETEKEEVELAMPPVWILDADGNTVQALTTALSAAGWSCHCHSTEDASALSDIKGVKAIIWNPAKQSETLMEHLIRAAASGVTLLPSLSLYNATKETDFIEKISNGASIEDGQSVVIRLTFETPVVVDIQSKDKEEITTVQMKPDDPEVAGVMKALLMVDLQKIKEICGPTLAPWWSVDYRVVGDDDAQKYVFSGLNWPPLDLADHMQYVEVMTAGIIEALS